MAKETPPPDVDLTRVRRVRSCSWCHASNPDTVRWCQGCGHAAHVARMACDCPQCQRGSGCDHAGPRAREEEQDKA